SHRLSRSMAMIDFFFIFFFQAEDGIRYRNVTGVQTCALPISEAPFSGSSKIELPCGCRAEALWSGSSKIELPCGCRAEGSLWCEIRYTSSAFTSGRSKYNLLG